MRETCAPLASVLVIHRFTRIFVGMSASDLRLLTSVLCSGDPQIHAVEAGVPPAKQDAAGTAATTEKELQPTRLPLQENSPCGGSCVSCKVSKIPFHLARDPACGTTTGNLLRPTRLPLQLNCD
jgi:hypothetical protein